MKSVIRPYGGKFELAASKRRITREVTAEIGRLLAEMQDVKFEPGVEIDLSPDNVAWHISYTT